MSTKYEKLLDIFPAGCRVRWNPSQAEHVIHEIAEDENGNLGLLIDDDLILPPHECTRIKFNRNRRFRFRPSFAPQTPPTIEDSDLPVNLRPNQEERTVNLGDMLRTLNTPSPITYTTAPTLTTGTVYNTATWDTIETINGTISST